MSVTVEDLMRAVEQQPEDDGVREQAARALEAGGKPAEAVKLLTERLVNLTAHEGPPLPCLCKLCIKPEQVRFDKGEDSFVREFSVARGRVLFYWVPEPLGPDPRVRRSVSRVMDEKLKPRRRR